MVECDPVSVRGHLGSIDQGCMIGPDNLGGEGTYSGCHNGCYHSGVFVNHSLTLVGYSGGNLLYNLAHSGNGGLLNGYGFGCNDGTQTRPLGDGNGEGNCFGRQDAMLYGGR